MKNKFFNFLVPYLEIIDKGEFFRKPFVWLYVLFAILNLIFPFFLLYQAISSGMFNMVSGSVVFGFIILWLTSAFANWIGFQIWWNRKDKVNLATSKDEDFVAIPTFSHFIQTIGEWFGTMVGIIGFMLGLISLVFIGNSSYYLSRHLGLSFINMGVFSIIFAPVYGFLIIIISRFIAELVRALVSIANNTKRKEPKS